MGGGHDQDDLVLQERRDLDFAVDGLRRHHRDLGPPAQQPFDRGPPAHHMDAHADIGIPAAKDRHQAWQDVLAYGRAAGDGQFADHHPLQPRHRLLDMLHVPQRFLRQRKEHFAGLAQHDAAPVALEKLQPELLLQVGDLQADRGLAEIEPPRRHREILGERRFDENAEFVKVQHRFSPWSASGGRYADSSLRLDRRVS